MNDILNTLNNNPRELNQDHLKDKHTEINEMFNEIKKKIEEEKMNQQNIKLWTDQLIRLISINEITSISDDDLNTYISDLESSPLFPNLSEEEKNRVTFNIKSSIETSFSLEGNVLVNPDVVRWLRDKRTDFDWSYWKAYKEYRPSWSYK